MESLEELVQFIKPSANTDVKRIALNHIQGLTVKDTELLIKKVDLLENIAIALYDKDRIVSASAFNTIVNISTKDYAVKELLKLQIEGYKNILTLLIRCILNPQHELADRACMALSNMTRFSDIIKDHLNSILPLLPDLLNAYVIIDFNKKGCTLNYLAQVFANLSCIKEIRKWLTEENPHVPLIKILPFFNYETSNIRRGGTIGVIRNLSFDSDFYEFLISNDIELLTYLLTPIIGPEDYPDDEMDKLPISLQYLPKEKQRDADPDIRLLVLETLNQFCRKRSGREFLRENGVYYVLRELHKWEKEDYVRLACENVVDILIQTEDEVGVEDFSTLDVPEDLKEKFEKIDKEYLNEQQES